MRKLLRAVRKYNDTPEAGHGWKRLHIAYLGNVTFDPLPDYVEVAAACRGISTRAYIAGYGQYMQELIADSAALNEFAADFIFINLDLRELAPDIATGFTSLDKQQLQDSRERILSTVRECIRLALAKQQANVIMANFPAPASYQYGIADQKQAYGEGEFYTELNAELRNIAREDARVQVLDVERLAALHGKAAAFSEKLYYLAKIPWQEAFCPLLADQLVRHVEAARGLVKKCLVLDLDNTLWGGVLGESGPHGIKVGHGDGESEAFFDFQRRIIALKNRGILLGICSKNNPEDVQEVFQQRPDMPLSLADFSAVEVSWNMKHENLERIAANLNIGLDSLVYIDDNPAECELIRQMLPDITTVLLPADPAEYPALLDRLHGFDKAVIEEEDRLKTRQYAENASRNAFQAGFDDLTAYFESLQTKVTIRLAGEQDKQRIHQLFAKTNQFNLTTRRYSIADIEGIMATDRYRLYVCAASDRFGDLGKIGVLLLDMQLPEVAVIDSFILSCRAMGRGIETAMMNYIKEHYLANGFLKALTAEFIPTRKNMPAENFYPQQGFTVVESGVESGTRYELRAADARLSDCHWIDVIKQVNT
jgi:FkbH-like protein